VRGGVLISWVWFLFLPILFWVTGSASDDRSVVQGERIQAAMSTMSGAETARRSPLCGVAGFACPPVPPDRIREKMGERSSAEAVEHRGPIPVPRDRGLAAGRLHPRSTSPRRSSPGRAGRRRAKDRDRHVPSQGLDGDARRSGFPERPAVSSIRPERMMKPLHRLRGQPLKPVMGDLGSGLSWGAARPEDHAVREC